MITEINESKTLTKHISHECKCSLMEENIIQSNGGVIIGVNVSVKNAMYVKKIMKISIFYLHFY